MRSVLACVCVCVCVCLVYRKGEIIVFCATSCYGMRLGETLRLGLLFVANAETGAEEKRSVGRAGCVDEAKLIKTHARARACAEEVFCTTASFEKLISFFCFSDLLYMRSSCASRWLNTARALSGENAGAPSSEFSFICI